MPHAEVFVNRAGWHPPKGQQETAPRGALVSGPGQGQWAARNHTTGGLGFWPTPHAEDFVNQAGRQPPEGLQETVLRGAWVSGPGRE